MDDENQRNPYWMLHFIVKHGGWIAIVAGVLPLLVSGAAVVCGAPWWSLAVGAVGTAFLFMLMRAFVELVRVMVDMLLPK
jgi:hypothetical protein